MEVNIINTGKCWW